MFPIHVLDLLHVLHLLKRINDLTCIYVYVFIISNCVLIFVLHFVNESTCEYTCAYRMYAYNAHLNQNNLFQISDIPKKIKTEQVSYIYMEIVNIFEKMQEMCDKLQLIFYNLLIFSLIVTIANYEKIINFMKSMINYVIETIQRITESVVFIICLLYIYFQDFFPEEI